jgi:hypothetical protein
MYGWRMQLFCREAQYYSVLAQNGVHEKLN